MLNKKCPLCQSEMNLIQQVSEEWNRVVCTKQSCALNCFVKDLPKLAVVREREDSLTQWWIYNCNEIEKQFTDENLDCAETVAQTDALRNANEQAAYTANICGDH